MIVSTTTAIDGTPVSEYVGVITGEAVLGANAFRGCYALAQEWLTYAENGRPS